MKSLDIENIMMRDYFSLKINFHIFRREQVLRYFQGDMYVLTTKEPIDEDDFAEKTVILRLALIGLSGLGAHQLSKASILRRAI